ncbi:alanine racemase [Antribacter gilvus]|uniref:alanine racemase n=1 Tax=Antribacter gilvus TaxID=2304675 RepID=UPI000F79D9EF|nr:alanine racemase [Antribacter gilvus]
MLNKRGAAGRIDGPGFSWPLLALDRSALDHNVATVAHTFASRGVEHAPHVKTHMARGVFERQLAAGAWGGTVATPAQLRTLVGWGLPGGGRRAFLANELVDPREVAWLRGVLERQEADEVWVYVDSARGVGLLTTGFAGSTAVARLGVLVELGVPGGRTGVRSVAEAVTLGRAVHDAGLRLVGVAGYEGPVAGGTSEVELAAVADWCEKVCQAGAGVADLVQGPVVLSAGGSAFADVVVRELTRPLEGAGGAVVPHRVVLRSGAYVTHDHGHYRRTDPWTRLGAPALRPAITVWASVLSVPEPGLVVCGIGRRDVSFDIDLPTPLVVRPADETGRLGAPRRLGAPHGPAARVTALNDQHAYVAVEPGEGHGIAPGDVIGFGVSHPCTTLDKHRRAVVVDGDEVVEQLTLEF